MKKLFDYKKTGDYIIIHGFKEGQFVEDVVIPEQIEGCHVLGWDLELLVSWILKVFLYLARFLAWTMSVSIIVKN